MKLCNVFMEICQSSTKEVDNELTSNALASLKIILAEIVTEA